MYDYQIIKGIYGDAVKATSRDWANAITKMADMQKNKKCAVLNAMKVDTIPFSIPLLGTFLYSPCANYFIAAAKEACHPAREQGPTKP